MLHAIAHGCDDQASAAHGGLWGAEKSWNKLCLPQRGNVSELHALQSTQIEKATAANVEDERLRFRFFAGTGRKPWQSICLHR